MHTHTHTQTHFQLRCMGRVGKRGDVSISLASYLISYSLSSPTTSYQKAYHLPNSPTQNFRISDKPCVNFHFLKKQPPSKTIHTLSHFLVHSCAHCTHIHTCCPPFLLTFCLISSIPSFHSRSKHLESARGAPPNKTTGSLTSKAAQG